MGSAKESLGNLVGSEQLRRTGQDQNAAGKQQESRSQVADWGEGVSERAKGAVGSVGAAVRGSAEDERRFQGMRGAGRERQRGAERDMERRGM